MHSHASAASSGAAGLFIRRGKQARKESRKVCARRRSISARPVGCEVSGSLRLLLHHRKHSAIATGLPVSREDMVEMAGAHALEAAPLGEISGAAR
jgi:hypothetical protein